MDEPHPIRSKLASFDLKTFSTLILQKIDHLSSDHTEEFQIYLKSEQSISKLKKLLEKYAQSAPSDSVATELKSFKVFLAERWSNIAGSSADRCHQTKANQVCYYLADLMVYWGFAATPDQLLWPTRLVRPRDEAEAHLCQAIVGEMNNRDELIAALKSLPETKWQLLLDLVGLEKLTFLLFKPGALLQDVLKAPDLLSGNAEYNKAMFFCLLELYLGERKKGDATYTSYLSYPISFLGAKVFSLADKKMAVIKAKSALVRDRSLSQFFIQLEDERSELGKHKGALLDGTLGKIVSLVQSSLPESHPHLALR